MNELKPGMHDPNFLDLLADTRGTLEEVRALQTATISRADVSPRAKIPFKCRVLRECLLHRLMDLSDSALELLEARREIPAFTLARSAMETGALMFYLHKKVVAALDSGRVTELDEEVLMRALFGSKSDPSIGYESINVLTALEHVDKYIAAGHKDRKDPMSDLYFTMCEFAHPNWMGTMGAYSVTDKEYVCSLGRGVGGAPPELGLRCLRLALNIGGGFHMELAKLDMKLREVCERAMDREDPATYPKGLGAPPKD